MAAKGGDSRNALIVALVIFVLLSLGLGVATYYGFAEKTKMKADVAQAETKEKDAHKTADWDNYKSLVLQAYIGAPLSGEDQTELNSLQQKYESKQIGEGAKDKAAFDKVLQNLQQRLGWDAVKKQPKETFLARVESLESQNQNLRLERDKSSEVAERTRKDMDDQQKNNDAEKDEITKALEASKKELAQEDAKKSKEFLGVAKDLEERGNEIEQLKQAKLLGEEQTKREQEKEKRRFNEIKNSYERLKDQQAPIRVEDYDRPKGRIISIDPRGTVAYVSLGSADNVKPRLTFSIFGNNPHNRAEGQRKGRLEIVEVRQAHLSMARILDVRDPASDPIMTGDLLFNPTWNPGNREHVAITGFIDLTGEGEDQSAELIRNLQDQGIVVDAYLDLKDMSVKGPGMNRNTGFLILGDEPKLEDNLVYSKDDQLNRKKEMIQKMSEMQNDAKEKGIPFISLKQFLSMIGLPTPRPVTGQNATYQNLPRPSAPDHAPGDANKKNKEEEPKDVEK